MAENDLLPLTWHIALTTVYALTCYTVIRDLVIRRNVVRGWGMCLESLGDFSFLTLYRKMGNEWEMGNVFIFFYRG